MATHSSTLAWEIPRTDEPSGLQSMGSQKSQTRFINNNPLSQPAFQPNVFLCLKMPDIPGAGMFEAPPADPHFCGPVSQPP